MSNLNLIGFAPSLITCPHGLAASGSTAVNVACRSRGALSALALQSDESGAALSQDILDKESDVVRVASFNVENLYDDVDDPHRKDETTPPKSVEDMRRLARALRNSQADIVSLQEVENLEMLNQFLDQHLPGLFPYRALVEGNDFRGIDVAVISRYPITGVVSHKGDRFLTEEGEKCHFRRDFLRVNVDVQGYPITVYAAHFKAHAGGDKADRVRLAEAQEAKRIVADDMEKEPGLRFVVTGDFNDEPASPVGRVFLPGSAGPSRTDDSAGQQDGSINGDLPPWYLTSAIPDPAQARGPGDKSHPVTNRTIDYLMFPEYMRKEFRGGGIQSLPREARGSDHNLIYGDFLLAP